MSQHNHRVLKRGLELVIADNPSLNTAELRRIIDQETVVVTRERIDAAVRYSENGKSKRWNEDYDLTGLTPSQKSAGVIWAKYDKEEWEGKGEENG